MTDSFDTSIAAFRDWMPYAGRHKGPATIEQYTDSAQRLARWAREQGHQDFSQLGKADLRAYLGSLHGRYGGPPSQSWTSTAWAGIRSLYRYLADEEDCKDIAASITVGRPAASGRITHLDAHQVSALMTACQTAKETAVIAVFLDAGVRIAEAARLKVSDAMVDDLRSRRIIVTGKGGKTRGVVIGAQTARALRRYLRERSRSRYASLDALWLSQRGAMSISGLDRLIRDVGARAGMEGVHPHLLRHTWSHHFRLAGGQLDDLVYLAGWSGPAMALKYGESAAAERAELKARDLSLVDRMRGRS